MNQILEVGTKIRAYDFFGMEDNYVEGVIVVVRRDTCQYELSPTKIVRGDNVEFPTPEDSYWFFVDFMGQRMVDDQWNRIEVIV